MTTPVRSQNRPPANLRGPARMRWIEEHGTAWQKCLLDLLSGTTWGVTERSRHRILAPLHALKDGVTYCTAAPAIAGYVHPAQKECPRCMALIRADADELQEGYYTDAEWKATQDQAAAAFEVEKAKAGRSWERHGDYDG